MLLALFLAAAAATDPAATDSKYAWDLRELYPTEAAWVEAKDSAVADIPKLDGCRGKLTSSASTLLACLETYYDLDRRVTQVGVYASMNYDLDTRVGRAQQMQEQARQTRTAFASASAWMRPEILAAGADKIARLTAGEPRLAPYRQPLLDVVRRAPHTLDAESERIVAETARHVERRPGDSRRLRQRGLPLPEGHAGKRRDGDARRRRVHEVPRGWRIATTASRSSRRSGARYGEFTRTLGTALNAQVQAHEFSRKMRKFDSSVEAALFGDNIPTAVYTQLIADVHANLPTLHRYLRLRQRMMGLDKLGYEDLYAPIVSRYDRTFTPEEAKAMTLEAVAPLGKEYQDILRKGFESRLGRLVPAHRQALGRLQHGRLRRRTRSSCRTSPASTTRSRRWRTSPATRCTRSWPTARSPTRRTTTRSSSPRSPRR